MIYCVQALRNKNKEIKSQKKPKSPYLSPMQKLQLSNVKVANTKGKSCKYKEEGRIDFYSTLNTCRMRIKAKEESAKIKIISKKIRIQTVHILVFRS